MRQRRLDLGESCSGGSTFSTRCRPGRQTCDEPAPAFGLITAREVEGLTESYGETVGIRDVSFQMQDGEIFGYLGPNEAGKTTIRTSRNDS